MNKKEEGSAAVWAIVLVVAAIFVGAGIWAAISYLDDNEESILDRAKEAIEDQESSASQEYPNLWTEAGLPEYPDATLIDQRQGRDLNDGVQVTFTTSSGVAIVSEYFDSEMASRGFEVPDAIANENTYFNIYKNGNKQLTLTVTVNEDDGLIKVNGNYVEL